MFKFYELVSSVTVEGTLKNDIKAYFVKRLLELQRISDK